VRRNGFGRNWRDARWSVNGSARFLRSGLSHDRPLRTKQKVKKRARCGRLMMVVSACWWCSGWSRDQEGVDKREKWLGGGGEARAGPPGKKKLCGRFTIPW
jgi:hypothetical protein